MLSVRAKDDASTLGCRQAVRHQTLTLTCVGSNPAIPAKYDPLAQSVEQLPFKQWVWSSNLQRVTKKADIHLGICFLAVWRFEKFNGTVLWTVPWHRLDDANSLPGAPAPGQRISSGSLCTKGPLQMLAAALPFYIGISIFALIRPRSSGTFPQGKAEETDCDRRKSPEGATPALRRWFAMTCVVR